MGKVRKEKKYRMHMKAPAVLSGTGNEKKGTALLPSEGVLPLPEDIMSCKAVVSLLAKKDPAGRNGSGRKKKDRMKLKREQWLQRVELSKKQKMDERATEARKKTVVVGDMQPLATSLPIIPISGAHKEHKQSKKPTRSLLNEINHYQDVLKHPAFKQDPMSTILEHVQNSIVKGTV